jgi:sulfate adenylyltransferase
MNNPEPNPARLTVLRKEDGEAAVRESGADQSLIPPYGDALVNLMADRNQAAAWKTQSRDWPSWELSARQTCDLELLLTGGFSPLTGFMRRADYERVCCEMRLRDGTLWPIPVVLDVSEAFAAQVKVGSQVALRDGEGVMLAVLQVEDLWQPDRLAEAETVYGTTSREHVGVNFLQSQVGPVYLGGKVEGLELPAHHDFRPLRHTPAQLRRLFEEREWGRMVAFQTRNPIHRAHFEMTLRAARQERAHLLIHPVVGMTRPGDVDHFCRVRCYQALLPRYPGHLAALSLLPLSMRMAGPREALWHAIIRRNYGCSHLIVGRDHAGPGHGNGSGAFYPPYAAQELVQQHEAELGVRTIPFRQMVYVPGRSQCLPADEISPGEATLDLSGTELRQRLAGGGEIPEWFTFPEVAAELRKTYPPRAGQGFTVLFTGLSGSGKSTLAKALLDQLLEIGGRPVTLLDGDIVRKNLSSELGFARAHRDLNIRRIGFVANEITQNGGIAICAPIAPYDKVRQELRKLISSRGGFILVHLSTPLEVCEQRDRKGLYAKARAGLIPEFTGISDPYEAPTDAELVLNTANIGIEEACQVILTHLRQAGYMGASGTEAEHATRSPAQALSQSLAVPARHRPRSLLDKVSRGLCYLDAEELCAQAMRRTGLEDFGRPSLIPALPILFNSLEQEARLRPLGRLLMRIHLRDLLETRLRLTEIWKAQSKSLEARRVEKPIFIVGMPRSGSTFLHEMLALDPDNRAPRVWEVMSPAAASGQSDRKAAQAIRKAEFCLWWFRRLAPRADSVYPMRALTPHECVAIQSYTFLSEEFISTCRIPSYEAFLRSANLSPAYEWEKRFLQHLQDGGAGRRWALKSPDHVYGLEALFAVFPDACLIQTHRNPLEVLASSTDLTQVLRGLYGRAGDRAETLAVETRTLADNTERFIKFRDRHPELSDRIVDVKYSELIADPLAAVRRIYDQFGLTLAESAAEPMRQLASNRSQYRGPRASAASHRLKLLSGLEAGCFERYCLRFALPFQQRTGGEE